MFTPAPKQGSAHHSSLRRLMVRHPVVAFLVMAFAVSIIITFVRLRTDPDLQSASNQYFWGFLEHFFSAALPAFLVVAAMHGKTGVLDLVRKSLRWRVGARWYLIVLLVIPIGSVLCASLIYGLAPLKILVDKWQILFTLIVPNLLFRIVFLNTIEEIGWLGFLQARFQDEHGPWKACLLVEIPFALWHLPSLIGDTGGQLSLALLLTGVYAIFQLCGRFVNLWLYNCTHRSVLLAGMWHANFNTTINMYAGEIIPVPAEPWFFIVSGVVAVWAIVLVILTRGRLAYPQNDKTQTAEASHIYE